jgi:hypothetical protein
LGYKKRGGVGFTPSGKLAEEVVKKNFLIMEGEE